MRAEEQKSVAESLFVGNGEISALLRSHDWSQTPLGDIETWSDSLKTAVQILLTELDQVKEENKTQIESALPPQDCTQTAALCQSAEAERKQVEASLPESEKQSRDILESITDAFFALDENWQFTYVNQTAYALVERPPGDLIGKSFWDEFPGVNDSEFEQMHRRVMQNRVAQSLTAFYPD
ncbi:PAS domain-containing protein, partial [uncultured Nostoc sp.]|uniref:PAS domain-containing protein n=1 Tax=uncultured Nostoc sp. TaxID=340711 RepID=UPI0035CB26F0